MMRVGTQKRSKSSSSPSPNSTYRQSPTSRYSNSSPINHVKNSSYLNYRQNSSPVTSETHKYAQEYHKKIASNSPSFNDRTNSPSYLNRNSPSYMQRTHSPNYVTSDSSDFITSRKLNEKRYDTSSPSPSFGKKADYESNYATKMSSMRISDSRSPNFLERSSPDVNYSTRYEKRVTESSRFNSFDQNDGIDTSPIVKVSSLSDQSAARRDSWDAIAKTRNMLSERSLESVANLTESQLDQELRRKKVEEHNRVFNQEHSYTTNSQRYSNSVDIYGDRDKYGRSSPMRIGVRAGGASSVKVQPVPDGVLGQPVEFESE